MILHVALTVVLVSVSSFLRKQGIWVQLTMEISSLSQEMNLDSYGKLLLMTVDVTIPLPGFDPKAVLFA